MNKDCLKLLEMQKIKFEKGLTFEEMEKIEKIYEIKFPDSLREFLMLALPISKGFYNWRNTEENNIAFIKMSMKQPMVDIDKMAEEIYWCDNWGKEPKDKVWVVNEVKERLKKAPKLLPIYAHRYMPMVLVENPPIISVHGIDIIYYGNNLEDYIKIEFGGKSQNTIDFASIEPIPFWSDIM